MMTVPSCRGHGNDEVQLSAGADSRCPFHLQPVREIRCSSARWVRCLRRLRLSRTLCLPLMNALEVSINRKRIGIYVPPDGSTFAAMVGNIPRKYMRAHIMTGNDAESWQWQLPNIRPGQRISFRLVNAPVGSGVPPQFIRARDPREVVENKRKAKKLYAKAKREMASRKRQKA